MLRITSIQDVGPATTVKLEGKLLEPWVHELLNACREAGEVSGEVSLDLSQLLFVDSAGVVTLRELRRCGVRLLGCSPLVTELLKENNA